MLTMLTSMVNKFCHNKISIRCQLNVNKFYFLTELIIFILMNYESSLLYSMTKHGMVWQDMIWQSIVWYDKI